MAAITTVGTVTKMPYKITLHLNCSQVYLSGTINRRTRAERLVDEELVSQSSSSSESIPTYQAVRIKQYVSGSNLM